MNFFKKTAIAATMVLGTAGASNACALYATFNDDSMPNRLASNHDIMSQVVQAATPSSNSFCSNLASVFAATFKPHGLTSLRWQDKGNNMPVPNRPGTTDDPFPRSTTVNDDAPGEFGFYVKGPKNALRGAGYTDGESYYFGQSVNEVAVTGVAPENMRRFDF